MAISHIYDVTIQFILTSLSSVNFNIFYSNKILEFFWN
jgi:hypothetical protein